MGMLDSPVNPSDGRFDAPDPSRFEAPAPARSRAWGIPLLLLAVYLMRIELHSVHPKGWLAAAVGLGAMGLGIAEIAVAKKQRDKKQSEERRRITR